MRFFDNFCDLLNLFGTYCRHELLLLVAFCIVLKLSRITFSRVTRDEILFILLTAFKSFSDFVLLYNNARIYDFGDIVKPVIGSY
jgi:hypothetical protein